MNLVNLTGRITKDLELKQAGQTQVTNFSMAVDNPFKKMTHHSLTLQHLVELLNYSLTIVVKVAKS